MCSHSPEVTGLTIMTCVWHKGMWGSWMTDLPTFLTFATGWALFLGQETAVLLVYWWAQLWMELKGEELVVCNIAQCSLTAIQITTWQLTSSCSHVNMPSLFSVAVFALLTVMENFWMVCSMINIKVPCFEGWGLLYVLADRLNYVILNSDSVWGVFDLSTIKFPLWLFI